MNLLLNWNIFGFSAVDATYLHSFSNQSEKFFGVIGKIK